MATFPIETLCDVRHDRPNLQTPRRIISLPNEILSSIRLLLVEHTSSGIQLPCKSFPFVCRQFRDLELSMPFLWTNVIDTMSPDRIELQILRSGNLGLSFFITSDWGKPRCRCAQLETIARYNDRWSRASVRSSLYLLDHVCFEAFEGTSFPSLERLETPYVSVGALAIINTWSVPRLRHRKCHSIVGLLRAPFTNPLTTLEIVKRFGTLDQYTLALFFTTPAASQLTSIKFEFCYSLCGYTMDDKKLPQLNLVTVKEFSLKIRNSAENEQTMMQLFERICLPNVEIVTIDMSYHALQRDSFIDWCRSLKNPSLRTVSLVVGTGVDWLVTAEVRASVQTKLLTALKDEFEGLKDRESSDNAGLRVKISHDEVE